MAHAQDHEDPAVFWASNVFRLALVGGVWAARLAIGVLGGPAIGLPTLASDALIVATQRWAFVPWRRREGKDYGAAGTWRISIFFLYVELLGILLVARDLWFRTSR